MEWPGGDFLVWKGIQGGMAILTFAADRSYPDPLQEVPVKIPVTKARGQLAALVRRAEAGDDVVLTRRGQPTVRLAPVQPAVPRACRRAVMEAARRHAGARVVPGPDAARSQDFLHDDDGSAW